MVTQAEKLTHFESSTVIRWFFDKMPMEQRRLLMTELPVYYARLTGSNPHEWEMDLRDAVTNAAREGNEDA